MNKTLSINNNTKLKLTNNKLKELIKACNNSNKILDIIKSGLYDGREDNTNKYELNAASLVKNAEDNRQSLIKNITPQELKTKLILKELNIDFEFQKIYYTGLGYYIVDFYLPKYNVIIEIDGSQHLNSQVDKRDRLRTENLKIIHKVSDIIRFNNDELIIDIDFKNKLLKYLHN